MGKINVDKVNGFSPVRTERKNDVKKSDAGLPQPIESTKTANEDRLDFSGFASEVGKLVEQIKELPDIREEKVNLLREQISAGTYDPSGDEIADSILRDEKE